MNRRKFVQFAGATVATGVAAACRGHFGASQPLSLAGDPAIDLSAFNRLRRFANTPFGKIAYVERGSGRAALFIHGYPLNGFQWRGAIERLSNVRRCIAPDLMGLGYSEIGEAQSLAPHSQADMLAALLDSLSIDAADVVANDSGGLVAQLLVARHPERVQSLLLTNCDVESDCPPRSFAPFVALAHAGVLADRVIAPALADHAAARGPKGLGGLGYANPLNPTDEAIDCYFSPLVSSPLRKSQLNALTIALGDNALAGSAQRLAHFERPVRIVWGAADTVFAKTSPDWLNLTFPRSRGVRLVEHGKLFFPEEQPDLIAAEARLLWNA